MLSVTLIVAALLVPEGAGLSILETANPLSSLYTQSLEFTQNGK